MASAPHCYCGDDLKHGVLSKHLFQKKKTIWHLKKYRSNDKLLAEIRSSTYYMF